MSEEKEIPINKYSIFELKAGLDKEISNYFLSEDFDEIERYSNIKILYSKVIYYLEHILILLT